MKVLPLLALLATIATAQESVFRQLTAREIREIELRHDPQLLETVARAAESVIIILDSALTGAFVQEGVNANIDCLPWLRNFPGGRITWLRSNFFVDSETGAINTINPATEIETGGRFTIGTPAMFNRWLNISATNIIQGREDADHGNYTCRVCVGAGDPLTRTDCHDATVTIYLPGAPPEINDTDSNEPDDIADNGVITYRIGADFCIERNTNVTFVILCDILGVDIAAGRATPIPTPNRIWQKNDLLVYNVTDGASPIEAINQDFYMANMFLIPGVLDPQNFLPGTDGEITFLTRVDNATNAGVPESFAREQLFDSVLGEWTCSASNVYGSDMATSVVRECGMVPVIPECQESGSIIFPERNEVVSVACDVVCIREGTRVTLDCTVTSGTPPITYTWTDGDGNVLSNQPTLTVSTPDNYSCNAENLDAPENREISLLSFSPQASFDGVILNSNGDPTVDNGCGRLRVPIAADACVFVGEALSLSCVTESGVELDIVDLNMQSQGGSHRINSTFDNINDLNGTFGCSLSNIEGPCGAGFLEFNAQVFDPARINRMGDFGQAAGQLGAGRFNEVQVVEENAPVTLFCPTTGIPNPTEAWARVVINSMNGCAMEVPITGDEDDFTINSREHPNGDVIELTINSYTAALEGTYVCRTDNIAGQDAATVSITSRPIVNDWSIGDWTECDNNCAQGTRQRSVVCRQGRQGAVIGKGRIVSDNFCDLSVFPASNETCEALFPNDCLLDPIWVVGSFGPCSRDCAGGFRFRQVKCQVPMTGEIRQDADCSALIRPSPYDFCPVTCCKADEHPTYCRQIGTRYCNLPAIQQVCCWTCGLSSIP